MSRTCEGCGVALAPNRGPGRPRKWCSERCRKAQYAGECIVCGGPTDGTTPSRGVPDLCQSCREWSDEQIIAAIQAWAQEHGGIPPTMTEWRRADVDHPCRALVGRRIGWNEALLAAGFALRCDRRPETQEWIEQQIRAGRLACDVAADLGVTPQAITRRLRYRDTSVRELRGSGDRPRRRKVAAR